MTVVKAVSACAPVTDVSFNHKTEQALHPLQMLNICVGMCACMLLELCHVAWSFAMLLEQLGVL